MISRRMAGVLVGAAMVLATGASLALASSGIIQVTVSRPSPETSQAAVFGSVRAATPDPNLPDVVATVNGQDITRLELAQAEEILNNGDVTDPYSRSTEEAALKVLVETTVADQAAQAQGLDPSLAQAKAELEQQIAIGSPLRRVLVQAGVDPNDYVTAKTVKLYQLAAGRAALEEKVTAGVPISERSSVWSAYVNQLVNSASIVRFGGL